MARLNIIILALVVLMPIPAGAQGRGHHNGAAVRPGPGPAFIGRPAPAVPAPAFIGRPAPAVPAPFVRNPRFPIGRPQPTIIVSQPYGIYSPYFWPAQFPFAPVYSAAQPVILPTPLSTQAPVVSQTEVDLAYQVSRLSQEIEQLRQQQALASRPAPPPEPPAIPTTLIFRDGHRIEIQNYAIVGQTLWVLDEKVSTKINVADLDLDAIQKENRGRGVRFPLPAR